MTNQFPHNGPYDQSYPVQPGAMGPAVPTTMPSSVRTAQVAALSLAAIAVVGVVAFIVAGDSYMGGQLMGSALPVFGAAIGTLFFGKAGNGARITVIVFAWLMTVSAVLMLQHNWVGGFGKFGVGILLLITLYSPPSREWFRRPRQH